MATEKTAKKLSRRFSAGGAVYREVPHFAEATRDKQVEWLLIQPAGTKRWQLPKGEIDGGEKGQATAEREVFEETGVKAQVQDKVESFQYFYQTPTERIFKTVTFYLMESDRSEPKIQDEWKHEIAESRWFATEAALEKLTFGSERKVLQKANELLQSRLI